MPVRPAAESRPGSAVSEAFSVHESAWTRIRTRDQRIYFFNRATGASQWSIPNELYSSRCLLKDLDAGEDLLVMPATARASLGQPQRLGVSCVTELPSKLSPEERNTRYFCASEAGSSVFAADESQTSELSFPTEGSRTLTIVIHSARGLRDTDFMPGKDKSDPYCRVEVMGKPETRCETPIVQDDLNPVWDFECSIFGVYDGDILLFQVFDKDEYVTKDGRLVEDDFLGKIMLPVEDISTSMPMEIELEGAGPTTRAFLLFSIFLVKQEAQHSAQLPAAKK